MKYPILYPQEATDFFTMGLGPVKFKEATVEQVRNGLFVFNGKIPIDEPIYPLVLDDYLIKADADHALKDQRFRIKRIVGNHEGYADIYAEHISYLASELSLKPLVRATGTASLAINQWKNGIIEPNPFVVDSDVTTTGSTEWRVDKINSPMEALGGKEGSMLDVWGGEYRFDNYHISLLKKRGTTANTVLAYGRNITSLEQEKNISSVHNAIRPFAIYTDDKDVEQVVTLTNHFVDVENIAKYPNRRSLSVDFSSEFEHDEIPTQARLTALAKQYITANQVGVPKVSIRVSFLDLAKSADYHEYKHLETLNLCDEVRVHYPKLGINTTAKVVRTVWNVLTESYDEIEIGEKRTSLSSQINEQNKVINEINTQTNYAITSANGKNTTFYGLYGPDGLGEPTATKIGDNWFKPNGEYEDYYVWTGTIWKLVMSTQKLNEIKEKIEQAEKDIINTEKKAQEGLDKANQSVADANFAKDIANDAKGLADQANANLINVKATADDARNTAKDALDKYQNMSYENRNLILDSSSTEKVWGRNPNWLISTPLKKGKLTVSVWLKANVTTTNARIYINDNTGANRVSLIFAHSLTITPELKKFTFTANLTQTDEISTNNIRLMIYDIVTASTIFTTKEEKLEYGEKDTPWISAPEDVQVQLTNINGELSRKVSQTEFNVVDGLVKTHTNQINQNKADIILKANMTDVNTLTGRVTTAEGKITTQAGLIDLKANSSVVDALTGRVTTAEGKITVTDGRVTTLTTKTDGNATQIGLLQTGFDGLKSTVSSVENSLSNFGGTNLILNTDFITNTANWVAGQNTSATIDPSNKFESVNSLKIVFTASGGTDGSIVRLHQFTVPYLHNGGGRKPLVTSVYVKADKNVNVGLRTGSFPKMYSVGTTWVKIEQTELMGDKFLIWADAPCTLWIAKPQVENGSIATAWSPATEDLATVTQFSALEQNLNGFKETVQNTYADKTTVTTLATQWQTTTNLVNGHTSQITSMGTAINLRVTQAQVDASILSDKSVKDTRNDNQPPSWYFANYPKQMAKELKNRTVIGLTQAIGTYVLLETDVRWNDASGGNIEQTAKADDGVYQRRGNSTTWTAWAKVADSSNIISQINISPESILIASKKIQIKGDTYIEAAVIKTAHIADLAVSGAKIANASIASAKIISLDASKISVGTLTGHTINGAYINGGSITGTSFFNSGADGNMSIANGRIRAKDFFVEAEGALVSLSSYVVVRSNENHVFLQPSDGYEVAVTKVRTAGGIGNYLPIRASHFRGGNTNATFESMNGYSVLRSSGDTQPVYLQGNEIRATKVSNAGAYVAVRASAFPTGSLEEYKTNIRRHSASALAVIRQSDIYDYQLKSEIDSGKLKTRIGLVIGHAYRTPSEIIDGDGVEQYAMNSLAWKAIQELDTAVTNTNNRLNTYDSKVIALTAETSINSNRINTLEAEVFRLKKRIEALEQAS